MFNEVVKFIKELYGTDDFIPLHEPKFSNLDKKYVADCIDSTFVSSVGEYVNLFEKEMVKYTKTKYAIAIVNGTAALHLALRLAGVKPKTDVLVQPLTFVATANAIKYCGASPIFLDVDKETLGIDAECLKQFITESCDIVDGKCINRKTLNQVVACVPMHTFGHPSKIDSIVSICKDVGIKVVEDAAESLGSFYKNKHTGIFGELGILSFNGNKIITTGGGGMILTNNEEYAQRAKHLSTTAKVTHPWEYEHDFIGFNYRLPNLNAALGCSQLEQLESFLQSKRAIAEKYKEFFTKTGIKFLNEPENSKANYWLNAVILDNRKQRDNFLEYTNNQNVMTRPTWQLINTLDMYKNDLTTDLSNAEYMADRLVNIPSSVNT